jgi:hypothetical protein
LSGRSAARASAGIAPIANQGIALTSAIAAGASEPNQIGGKLHKQEFFRNRTNGERREF